MTGRTLGDPQPCRQCGAQPGEQHDWCDIARCRSTGQQLIQCEGEKHEFNGREYGEHEGRCEPHIHDGYYPGTLQCYELGWFTDETSVWGVGPDLNRLVASATGWDAEKQRFTFD